jgi:hypothetical protein
MDQNRNQNQDQTRNQDQDRNQNQGAQGAGQDNTRNQDRPNQNANKEQAEGSRGNVRSNEGSAQQGAGITNRPLDQEQDEQAQVPPRGQTKDEEQGNA